MAVRPLMLDEEKWRDIFASRQSERILTGILSAVEKHKLDDNQVDCGVVFYNGIKVIIPITEMGVREDWRVIRSMIGSEIDFIVKGIDVEEEIAVASRKAAQELRRKLELPKHKPGDRVMVRVVAVGRDRIRVDLYGVEVVVPKNEIEYGYVANPADHVQIGDRVPAVIRELELMTDPPRIKLSLKDAKPDPFVNVPKKYRIGGEYLAVVTGLPQYGVFVNLEQGVSALCPYPRWSNFDLEVGDRVLVKIKKINVGERKITGSLVRLIRKGVLDNGSLFVR